jgi:hypothetical protein
MEFALPKLPMENAQNVKDHLGLSAKENVLHAHQ